MEEREVAPDIIRIGEIHDLVMAKKLPREALDYAWARLWAQRAADAWEAANAAEGAAVPAAEGAHTGGSAAE